MNVSPILISLWLQIKDCRCEVIENLKLIEVFSLNVIIS